MARSSAGGGLTASATGVKTCSRARSPWSHQLYSVWRETPNWRLRALTTPYSPLWAIIWATPCARSVGVLG